MTRTRLLLGMARERSSTIQSRSGQLSVNSKMPFAPKPSVSWRLAGLLGLLMPWSLAYAAGATGPPGLKGLVELLLQISIYPFIGVALAFVVFNATKRAWVFFTIPFFYWGLSSLAPIVPAPTREDSPAVFIGVGAWLYLPLILATAIAYRIYGRKKKVWIFVLVPVLGWILQLVSLLFIVPYMNRTIHL